MTSAQVSTERAGTLGALALGTDLAHDAILATVRDVHGAVSKRVHSVTDLVGGHHTTLNSRHGGVSGVVYRGIGAGIQATTNGLRAADRAGVGRRLEDSPRGQFVMAALNGIFGDRIRDSHPELAITMAVRMGGRDVALDPAGLGAAYPEASGDLVVFLHGLSESESFWDRRRSESGGNYGERLAADAGWTPIFVRANSGLSLAENGVALAGMLDRLVEHWPTDVRRIALIGHSLGGLVMRSACAVVSDPGSETGSGTGSGTGTAWNTLVTDVVTLGTPHLGAPIARVLTAGSAGLSRLPESAPFGAFLDNRAVSISDLRTGLPPDVQNLPHARYHLVAATLTRSARHPVAEVAGDLLVRYPSAVGKGRRGREMFPGADVLHVPGADHFDLLNHEDVYAAIRGWLTAPGPDAGAGHDRSA
jgi:pimeloyl-ACP methyl ester carboxylesterase